ncbi:MAG: hypothetical protein OEZ09_07265 [Betaproteobacteria bacterium]|nr:hypothetical protein [Betaproteobacteria bacterium]MDH5210265.1 hypothetical protein [Betaproteobacteria bacterium]MDH5578244.1 hypothetical protein [Betaproteobacteria bacterium]
MSTTQPQVSVPQWLGQQLLGPLDDAAGLVRRYRELDAFRDYLADRLRLVVPIGLLVVATAVACGLAPIVAFLGTNAVAALLGLLLAPLALIGSLFVLSLALFSWLEERSLSRALGHRTGPAPTRLARWLKRKLGADLGRLPRPPWLLGALFVVAPLALLAKRAPVLALGLVVLLALAPILFARLDR